MQVMRQGSDIVLYIIEQELAIQRQNALSSTQKDQARNEGYKTGRMQATCDAIAHILTERRIKAYAPILEFVPIVTSHSVKKLLVEPLLELNQLHTQEMRDFDALPRSERGAEDRRALRDKHVADWMKNYQELLLDLNDPQLDAAYKEGRRQKILAGEIEPDVDDENWLAEEIEKREIEATNLKFLLKKAQAE